MAVVHSDNLEKAFNAAVNVIKSLPKDGDFKPPPDMMLRYYANFKQATVGACNITKPWAFDVVAKAKWDAWNNLANITKEEAMQNYVNELAQVYEKLPVTPESETFGKLLDSKAGGDDDKDEVSNVVDERDASKDDELHPASDKVESPAATNGGGDLQGRIDSICSDSDEEFCDPSNNELPAIEAEVETPMVLNAPQVTSTQQKPQVVYITDQRISQFHDDIAGKMVALERKMENTEKLLSSVDSKVKDPSQMCAVRKERRRNGGGAVMKTIKNLLFPGLPWKTVIFVLLWPLIVNLAIKKFGRK